MDEIKSIISQLPSQDIIILKTIYNPDVARQELSDNGQRMISILDWLTPEEQQDVVNVTAEDLPQEEQVEPQPKQEVQPQEQVEWWEEAMPNPAGNLEDFLI